MSKRPQTGRDFTQSVEFHSWGNPTHVEPSQISTKAEVDRLEALRANATAQMHLKPRMYDHARADSGLYKAQEWRLESLKTRLAVAQGKHRIDRLQAVHEGRAKAAFNSKARTPSHSSAGKDHERGR